MSLLATSVQPLDGTDDFARWFEELLVRRGLSAADALWLLRGLDEDIHSTTVHQWRGGRAAPSYEQLVTIARAFGELPPALTEPLRDAPPWARSP